MSKNKGQSPNADSQQSEDEICEELLENEDTSEEEAGAQVPAEQEEESELQALQRRFDELNDRHLRILAEYDNFRRRSQREKESVYPGAVANTVEKYLPVMDNFERALNAECSDTEFKKGMEMIFSSLKTTFTDLGVTEIGLVGEAFDANIHHAVMHVDDDSLAENSVTQVMQKGYRIGERVLRCAMVSVAN